MINEADTCRKYVVKNLYAAGWSDDQINEQKTFTDGRIHVIGKKVRRGRQKRADYILRLNRDYPLAVVEAKAAYKHPGDGIQQAKEYAEILKLSFAYSTNGTGIIEHDYTTGQERELTDFPSPAELWSRLKGIRNYKDSQAMQILSPFYHMPGKTPRYYQEIAINKVAEAITTRQRRVLLTMATGTGKTFVAFQICYKLWNARWNCAGEHRRPRILYLADRNILIDDPKDKMFVPFGDARYKIENGEISKGREMYFAIYQAIAEDKQRPGLYKEFSPDFFDLIVVDECHRGSANDESRWRGILEYFEPAYQLGMTATPLRGSNRNTYDYFGSPVYTYSLRQGIEDGFLAPYRVQRILTNVDAFGWRPEKGEIDRYGREIPDGEYGTRDFDRSLALRPRSEAIAAHLTEYLRKTDRYAKTIVFCVDQEHAEEMRMLLSNLNSDLVKDRPDYVARVVSEEGTIGRGHLSRFQELETDTPVILTTSQMLTTGVDVPTCKNVVIARVINSMVEFKQIIGRGTRVRDDYGKLYFTILDYTGSATRLFADPEFDGEPVIEKEVTIDSNGKEMAEPITVSATDENLDDQEDAGVMVDFVPDTGHDDGERPPRKFYVDNAFVEITDQMVYELDAEGYRLRAVKFIDYTADGVRSMYSSAAQLRSDWTDLEQRAAIIDSLEQRGIDLQELADSAKQPEADPFDLLCYIAFSAPIRTRRERAERLRKEYRKDFFEKYTPAAREILEEILQKYEIHGIAQFKIPDVLQIEPIAQYGNVIEIANLFGGASALKEALKNLQNYLYNQ
jgi:type I restriction enzyme R subunit